MKRFWTWLRVVSPAEWVFLGMAVLTLLLLLWIGGLGIAVELIPGFRSKRGPFEWWTLRLIPCFVPQLAALAYGFLRAATSHPLRHEQYLRWLRATAWQPSKPLPLGPVTLCLQDAWWLGVFTAVAGLSGYPLALVGPIPLALGVFSAYHVRTLASAGPYWAAYAARFAGAAMAFVVFRGVALAVATSVVQLASVNRPLSVVHLSLTHSLLAFGLLPLIVVVVQVGLRQQLQRVATDAELVAPISKRKQLPNSTRSQQDENRLGWPLGDLNPQRSDVAPSTVQERIVLALLMAWCVALFVSAAHLFRDERLLVLSLHPEKTQNLVKVVSGWALLGVAGLAGLKTAVRFSRYRPPCDLLGRIQTGRWVLRGYDQVFRTPLLSLLVALIGAGFMFTSLGGGILAFLFALAIALLHYFGPPDEETFRLTGCYRLARPVNGPSEPAIKGLRTHFWD